MAVERSETSFSELERLSHEAKQALRDIKDEVKGQKVDKSKPTLELARDNFAFIHRLIRKPVVNEYLELSGRWVRIFRPLTIVCRAGLSITSKGAVSVVGYERTPLTYGYDVLPFTFLDLGMDKPARRSITKGLAKMKKTDIVGKFESATRLAWITIPL